MTRQRTILKGHERVERTGHFVIIRLDRSCIVWHTLQQGVHERVHLSLELRTLGDCALLSRVIVVCFACNMHKQGTV